ncbi:MAG TPA: glycosyltransferase family 9 protein [Pirellulales bacterium]|jgi:ADP-heptose:LPS heptosyltransferase
MHKPDHLRRILLIRNDRIGDLVLTLPAIEAVRRTWPSAHLALLASSYAAPLLADSALVDKVMLDEPAQSARALADKFKSESYDAAIVFNYTKRACLAAWLARIPRRVCWAYKPLGFLTANRRVRLHRSQPPVHEARFALAFAERLGCAAAELDPTDMKARLEVDPIAAALVRRQIERELGTAGPLFGVHPLNSHSAYNWPLSRYMELVARLAQVGRVVVTGHAKERRSLDQIRSQLPTDVRKRVLFLCDLSLTELVAAVSELNVLTVSSTGPMHIAAAIGTPVVGLFSPHPSHVPAKWAPLGRKRTLFVAPLEQDENPRVPRERGAAVMARITVEEVLAANLAYAMASPPAASRVNHAA